MMIVALPLLTVAEPFQQQPVALTAHVCHEMQAAEACW